MKRRNAIAVVCAVMLVGSTTHAAPYGAAGCGFGAAVFGDQEGFIQVIAATFNGFLGSQTFGITSGTLGCGPAQVDVRSSTEKYIEGNREVLAREIARGQGDTIVGIAAIAGCGDVKNVGAKLQSRYEAIFPTDKVETGKVTDAILSTLKSEPALGCQNLG